jgi:hypothetical protein
MIHLRYCWNRTVRNPVLCIKPPPGLGDVRSIVARVLASGRAWVAVASFEGSEVIRACATHGETTPDDVLELVRALLDNGDVKGQAISRERDRAGKQSFAD